MSATKPKVARYPRHPRHVGERAWFYEEPKGMHVLIEPVGGGQPLAVVIPWRKLEAAVANRKAVLRHKAKPKRKAPRHD